MRTLYIVRHGNTFSADEPPRRIGRETDIPLTADGVAQGEKLGAYFAERRIGFKRVLSGPLQRTRQTASAILAATTVAFPKVEIAEWLAEIDHGPDENQIEADIVRRLGTAALDAWSCRGVAPPGWRVDAEARIAAWRDAMTEAIVGDTLLVTSNGAARFALMALTERPAFPSLKLRTGAFGTLADFGSGWHGVRWDVRP